MNKIFILFLLLINISIDAQTILKFSSYRKEYFYKYESALNEFNKIFFKYTTYENT